MELLAEGKFITDSNFKAGHLRTIESMMEAKNPGCGIKGVPHIQSRLKTLKAIWQVVYDMVYGANTSGFGWDPEKKCVTAEASVWDEYVKSKKKAAVFRNKSFPHFDDFCSVWGKDRATGRDAQSACDVVEEVERTNIEAGNNETVDLDSDMPNYDFSDRPLEQGQEALSGSRKRRRTSMDRDEKFMEMFQTVATQLEEALNSCTARLCDTVYHPSQDAEVVRSLADNLYLDLLRVDGLAEDEVYRAHIGLSPTTI